MSETKGKIHGEQADALLDVYEQCLVVITNYEQHEAHLSRQTKGKGSVSQEVAQTPSEDYLESLEALVYYAKEARELGVEQYRIANVITTFTHDEVIADIDNLAQIKKR